jgi:hypothetical protein
MFGSGTTFNVLPDGDGYRIEQNGRDIMTRGSQSAAISAARSRADDGDQIIVHGREGMIVDRITVGASTEQGMTDKDAKHSLYDL